MQLAEPAGMTITGFYTAAPTSQGIRSSREYGGEGLPEEIEDWLAGHPTIHSTLPSARRKPLQRHFH
jgi:hypothetical protein